MNMQDVRLIAGEGKLQPKDVLAACNVRIAALEAELAEATEGWVMSMDSETHLQEKVARLEAMLVLAEVLGA